MIIPSEKDVNDADMTEVIGLHDRSCAWVNDFSSKTPCDCPRGRRQRAFATSLVRAVAEERTRTVERAEQLRVAVEAIDEAYTVALIKDQTKITLSRVRQALENARLRMPPLAVALYEENALRSASSKGNGK